MTIHLRSLTVALLLPCAVTAQDRRLDWPAVTVTAHLDSTGTLTVRELQTIRLTGDWNGAERTFNTRLGQTLSLSRLARIDSLTGAEVELRAENDVNEVDEFTWSDNGETLRWRARLPDDPPFDNTLRSYLIETVHGRILLPQSDGSYLLDHNFAMIDREGFIERYSLTLTLDPVWETRPDFTGSWHVDSLPPGTGFLVTLPLRFKPAGRPSSVRYGASAESRRYIQMALIAALLLLLARLALRERRLGRFAPLLPASAITPEWLGLHVLSALPEVVGAAWDDHTSSPEVAATLARLVQEGKLSSRVKTQKLWVFESQVLHLTIEGDRSAFRDHERALIDALFQPGERTTSTTAVRERYKKTGFDPAALIAARLKQLVELTTPGAAGTTPSRWPTIILALGALALIGLGIARDLADGGFAIVALFVSLFAYLASIGFAAVWQRRVTALLPWALGFVLPIGALAYVFAWRFLELGNLRLGAFTLAGVALLLVAYFNSICNVASSRESVDRIARRKRLAAARRFFAGELRRPQPRLQDAWFPYVIAFGLGRQADRWFRAFGGAAAASTASAVAMSHAAGGSSRGDSHGGGWSGFGGGGGFAGAGSSASFAAAVGGMAGSVAAPSSGGGGGSSGGGSSGGGGGGGW